MQHIGLMSLNMPTFKRFDWTHGDYIFYYLNVGPKELKMVEVSIVRCKRFSTKKS